MTKSWLSGTLPRKAVLALVAVAAVGVVFVTQRPRDADGLDTPRGALRLSVAAFRVPASVQGQDRMALEEALAARLNTQYEIVARANGRLATADYVLEGDVSPDKARLVITLRIRSSRQRAALWTATFWRWTLVDSTLAHDLAAAVGDAMALRQR